MAMTKESVYKMAPVCKSGAKILYAWAMDAPPLKLPQGRLLCPAVAGYFALSAVLLFDNI